MRTRLSPAALVLMMAACNGDDGLKVIHEPPVITIFEPAIGTTFFEEQLVTFKAEVTTLDGSDVTDVSHSWVAGEATICESTGVPADGIATCTTSFSDAGAYTITVTAINTRSDRATATVDINVAYNEPPTVQLIAPESGASLQSNDLVIFEALLADAEDEADELTVTVTSSKGRRARLARHRHHGRRILRRDEPDWRHTPAHHHRHRHRREDRPRHGDGQGERRAERPHRSRSPRIPRAPARRSRPRSPPPRSTPRATPSATATTGT
jgi:hypothetical protein